MTKKELMQKWGDLSRPLKKDIETVIEHEIIKAKKHKITTIDKNRFERLLCAVVSSGHNDNFDADLIDAKYLYEQLELYYYNN